MSPVAKKPDILPVMVGTAGHVDHGKTSLVKLLTGCDTDRLKEEKQRGLSINIGFAPCMLPGNRMVGIIDVPGHLDFIRNMVAGAASMDILMLIIAADDSIMPQTREHLEIIRLLRAPKMMVVVTKIDLVDQEMLELVIEDVKNFTKETGYADAPVLPVSNVTLDGISHVRKELDQKVSEAAKKYDQRAFRMNIERIFSVKGYGTVTTGIPTSGGISIGDQITLYPSGKSSRVRAIQNYKHESEHTGPNMCAAINLADISPDDLHRGMTIASPDGKYSASQFIVAQVQNIGNKYQIRQNMELRFHYGTGNVSAKLSFISGKSLAPGDTDFAKIRLKEPVTLVTGDRFILRRLSPSATLGGGTVLSNIPHKIKDEEADLKQSVKALTAGDHFAAELYAFPKPIATYAAILGLTHLGAEGEKAVQDKITTGLLIDLKDGAFLLKSKISNAASDIKKQLTRYHKAYPLSWGMDAAEFANIYQVRSGNFAKFAGTLAEFDKELSYSHQRIALASFEPEISREEMTRLNKLVQLLTKAGINAPAIGDLSTTLDSNKKDVNKLIRMLTEEGKVVNIGKNIILKSVFDQCHSKLREFFKHNDFLQINDFRDMTGAGRNLAVAILEKLDTMGFTKRTEKGRKFIK